METKNERDPRSDSSARRRKRSTPAQERVSDANRVPPRKSLRVFSITQRASVSASIRRAFASRHGSIFKPKHSSKGREKPSKYRQRDSSGLQSVASFRSRLAPKNIPQLIRNSFFWLDENEYEGVTEIILELRRFIIHLIYLSLIWSIFATLDFSDKYASVVLSDSITLSRFNTSFGHPGTFKDLRSIDDVWSFINEVLLQILFDPTDDEKSTAHVLTSMILIGAPQMRQIRVKSTDCYYHPIMRGLYRSCFDYYSKMNEDKEPFGMNYSAWRYTSVGDRYEWAGHVSTYGGGGYVMNFSDYESSKFWVRELEENSWIRPGTRAVIVTFITATPSIYCAAKLAFELPPAGGVLTSSSFRTAKFNRFVDKGSFFTLSCEIFLILFAIYYSFGLWLQLSKKTLKFTFWTFVEIIIITLSYAVIIIEAIQFLTATTRFQRAISVIHTTEYVTLDGFLKYQFALECCGTVLLFFALVKLFKFASLTKPTRLICCAVDNMKFELLAVVITTAVMTMGFAVLGLSIFGSSIAHMETLWESFFSLIFLSASNFTYYKNCFRISKFWTSIFFPAYILFIFLFFLNTCVALVVFGFVTATEEQSSDQKRLYLGEVIKEIGILVLPYFGFHRLSDKLMASQLFDTNTKEYDAFVRILLKYDWKWREIQLFMRRHSLERGDKLSFEQLNEAYNDFWVRQLLALEHKEEYDKDEHKAECDKDEHKEECDKDEHKEECDEDEHKEELDVGTIMEEKRDKTLEFLEDEFREGAEGKRKILPERKAELKPSETAGEGDSSIEGGLRRRFVSFGETLERKDQTGSLATKCETVGFFKERCSRVDIGRFKSHGSTLRRILESEMPSRGQPSKSKKKRKKRHSEWVQLKKRRSQTGITGDSSIIIGTFKRTNRNKVKIFKDFREFILPSVWKTGDDLFDSDQAEEALPIIILRDFILYLLFLIVVWLVTFGTKCSAYNFYSDVYQRLITNSSYNSSLGSKISFEDTQFPVDMWTFILDVVCAVLYDKTLVDKTSNVYFGAPRLRQLRVRGKTCSSAPMFQSLYADCADYYSEGIEDKDDFGPKTSAWKYSPHRGAQSYFTGVVSTYPEGGFVMNFTADEEFTRSFISQLRDENWREQPAKLKKRITKWNMKVKKDQPKIKRVKSIDTSKRRKKTMKAVVQNLWKTGDEFIYTEEDSFPLFVMRDFVIYLLFMVVVFVITFGPRSPSDNYCSEVFRTLITKSSYNSTLGLKIGFEDTQFVSDMWTFIIEVICSVMYDKTLVTESNVYFGAPRLRQVRVRGKTCSPAPMFQSLYADCADYYSQEIEDKDAFGLNTSAWRYLPSTDEGSHYSGLVSTYYGGGFVLNFTAYENFTRSEIAQLRDENWIRIGTRVIFVEFTVFNPVTHLFCVCKVIFEFPPYGGIIPSFSSSALRLLRYVKPWDYFILSCELILVCFTLYYSSEEFLQIYRLQESYLSNRWNILDLLIIVCCYVVITFGVILTTKASDFVERNISSIHTSIHVPFDNMVKIHRNFDVSKALLVFISWLKIFKFSTLNRKTAIIFAAFSRGGSLIAAVTAMVTVAMMGFSLISFTLFSSVFLSFGTFASSITASFGTLVGGVNYWKYDGHHVKSNFGTLFGLLAIGTRHGYDDLDIDLMLEKHSIIYGFTVNTDLMSELYDDILLQNQLFIEVEAHSKLQEQIEGLTGTIMMIDGTLMDILTLVDILTDDDLKKKISSDSSGKDDIKPGQDQPNDGNKRHGSISRRILNPETFERGQPAKLKRRKIKRKMTKWRTSFLESIAQKQKEMNHTSHMWKTGDELKFSTADFYPILVMRDLVLYLIFLVVIMIITFGTRGSADNYYSEVFRRLITNSSYNSSLAPNLSFGDTQSARDMWTFIIDVLCMVLYDKTIMNNNVYFGAPRLRQVRVRGKTCSPAPMFQSLYADCADYYSQEIEDKDTFGLNTSAWRYLPSTDEGSHYSGLVSTYYGGGFVLNFTEDENFTRSEIAQLRDENWVGFGTRVIFVEFGVFNPVTHLFCVCKVIFEFPPYGGIIPSFSSWTLKLLRYVTWWDYFILSCELMLIFFTLYYSVEELMQMYQQGSLYLSNWWKILDILIIICCYATITFGIILTIKASYFVERNLKTIHTSTHVPFDEMTNIQSDFDVSRAVVMFVVWLKIFKFCCLNRSVALILAAYSRAGTMLITATVGMMIITMGSAVVAHTLISPLFHGYETYGRSILSHLRTLAGGMNFWKYDGHHIYSNFGTAFGFFGVGVLFPLVMRVVILNIYVAVLANSFEEEEMQFNQLTNSATITDYFSEVFCSVLRAIGKYGTANRLYLQQEIKQNIRIHDALLMILMRHGFEDLEISLMMEKHHILYGNIIPIESMIDLYNEIHLRNQLSLEAEAHRQLEEQIEEIDRTVSTMDAALIDIMSKLDVVTDRYLTKQSVTPRKSSFRR
ncbi:hypothetical protein GE061_015121 [Apolygus lucorum]|uniref:Polycystin domain-containing protein n=1 Tax=Apolygus lucorum TaxID=248454 RepID=A0A8S9XLA4_APOLU|nr:hypothetical protein GE061_015121 [Apolygus lucorum]